MWCSGQYLCWWTAVSSEETCCWHSLNDRRTSVSMFCQQPCKHCIPLLIIMSLISLITVFTWLYWHWSVVLIEFWRCWRQLRCPMSGPVFAPHPSSSLLYQLAPPPVLAPPPQVTSLRLEKQSKNSNRHDDFQTLKWGIKVHEIPVHDFDSASSLGGPRPPFWAERPSVWSDR